MQLPIDDKQGYKKEYLEGELAILMGAAVWRKKTFLHDMTNGMPATTSSAPVKWPARWCASGA